MPCERQVIRWRRLRPPECEFPNTRLPEHGLLCHPPHSQPDSANKTERQELSVISQGPGTHLSPELNEALSAAFLNTPDACKDNEAGIRE